MSNPDPDQIIQDFNNSIDTLHEFVTQKSRDMGDVQKLIILRRQVEHLKTNVNRILNVFSGNLSERTDIVSHGANKIRSIMNRIPDGKDYKIIRLNLSSYHAILLTGIANPVGIDSVSQIQAQANLLSHLLLDVNRIEDFPKVTEWSKEVFDRRRAHFNAIQIKAGLFSTATGSVYLIDNETIISWINEAFWHFQMLIDYHKTIDYEFLWQQHQDDYAEYYRKAWSSFLPLSYIPSFIYLNYQLWGDEWPNTIDTQNIVQDTSINGICQSIYHIFSYFTKRKNDIVELFTEGKVDQNAKPENFTGYNAIQRIEINMNRILQTAEAFGEIDQEDNLEHIINACKVTENYFNRLIIAGGGKNKFINNTNGQAYASTVPVYLGLVAKLSIKTQDNERLKHGLKNIKPFTSQISVESHPITYYSILLTKLYVNSKLQIDYNTSDILSHLEKLLNYIEHVPRLYLSTKELQMLLKLKMGSLSISDIDQELHKLEKISSSSSNPNLRNAIENIKLQVNKTQKHTITSNELDIHSWMRPVFKINEGKDSESIIEFVPVYTQQNRII